MTSSPNSALTTQSPTAQSPEDLNAVFMLGLRREMHPELVRAEAAARLKLVNAIIAMDQVDDGPALNEQVDVEEALRAYGHALAALVRGDTSDLETVG